MGGKLKRFFWLWLQCFKSMRSVQTFVPFLLYAIIQTVLLFALINFSKPPFSGLFVPIIRSLFGEPALHYPNFFMVLSPLYSQINIILSGLIGIVIIGMATYTFAGAFNGEPGGLGKSLKITFPKYGTLFVIWIIETALTLVMIIGVPRLLDILLQPSYRMSRIFELVGLLLAIFIASIFAYTTVLIILDKQKLFQSIAKTFSIFKKNAGTSFFLVAVPTLLYFPINFLTRKAPVLMTKFSPEIIVLLLGTGILISLFSSYFMIGSITRFYLLLSKSKTY